MSPDFKNAKSALAEIEAGIDELATSEGWVSYLKTAAKFHKYSMNNLMLIAMQRPDATQVAGYNTWKNLGRQVMKGEAGIRILAPMTGTDEETGEQRTFGFRTVAVFDVSQTEGEGIVEPPVELLSGEAPEGIYGSLVAIGAGLGYTTSKVDDIGGANGETNRSAKTISILSSSSPAQAVKTMAHELGHVILHGEGASDRARAELEAESVAFIICRFLGIDSDDYSFGYVLTWSENGEDAKAGLKESASRILKAADQIIKSLETAESQAEGAAA